MKMNIRKIVDAAKVAQQLIGKLHDSDPTNPAFEQAGLLDGQEIVLDYIDHNEWGLALEHVLYMIHESDICFPRETMLELHDIARSLGISNHYSKENQRNLTEEEASRFFNAP